MKHKFKFGSLISCNCCKMIHAFYVFGIKNNQYLCVNKKPKRPIDSENISIFNDEISTFIHKHRAIKANENHTLPTDFQEKIY